MELKQGNYLDYLLGVVDDTTLFFNTVLILVGLFWALSVLILIIGALRRMLGSGRADFSKSECDSCFESNEVWLVHGTWARNAKWTQQESKIPSCIMKTGKKVKIRRFQWSGQNSILAREYASRALVQKVKEFYEMKGAKKLILVGHSHGGTVILNALQEISEDVSINASDLQRIKNVLQHTVWHLQFLLGHLT